MISFSRKQGIVAIMLFAFSAHSTVGFAMDRRALNRSFVNALVDLFQRLVRTENGYDDMLPDILSNAELAAENARVRHKACNNVIVALLNFKLFVVRDAFFKKARNVNSVRALNYICSHAERYCIEKPTEFCNALKAQYQTADELKAAVSKYVWKEDFAACDRGYLTLEIHKVIDAFYGVGTHREGCSSSSVRTVAMEQDCCQQEPAHDDVDDPEFFYFADSDDCGTPYSDEEDEGAADDTPVDDCSSVIDQPRRRATLPLACPVPRGGMRDSLYVAGD